MKVLHVTFSIPGGAGTAAQRLHHAELASGIDSQMCYFKPFDGKTAGITAIEKKLNGLENILLRKLVGDNAVNLFPTRVLKRINESNPDIVHLHWINAEMMSVEQIPRIKTPLVWTFHDMWPFCGAEHYTTNDRYITGYVDRRPRTAEAPPAYRIMDVDSRVFRRKEKYWSRLKLHTVCPSNWLAECVAKSALMSRYPVSVVANCLDLNTFAPLENKAELRKRYGLDPNKKVILFGAYDANLPRKGNEKLERILKSLQGADNYVFAVFGKWSGWKRSRIPVKSLGMFESEEDLARLYNMADVFVAPSLLDNLPNTLVESVSCGTPCVAFDVGGIKDVITHQETGYLARPYDEKDFARGISWVLESGHGSDRYRRLRTEARRFACEHFSPETTADRYFDVYRNVLARAE